MAKLWPPWEVTSSRSNLDQLREVVLDLNKELPPEAVGWLARLLVLRSCGHLEQTVLQCARGYIEGKSGGPVQSFGLTWLTRSRNPSLSALKELAGRFEPTWGEDLDAFLGENDEALRTQLSNLVAFRNKIAHGENQGVNREKALALSVAAEEIADWWIRTLNPG